MTLLHPVDRLILDESAPWADAKRITVLDDPTGDLVAAVAARSPAAEITVHADSCVDERAVREAVRELTSVTVAPERAEALDGTDLVLVRLPREVDAIAELAEQVAALAGPQVRIVGGARVKHLVPAMNDALGRGFAEVRASLGRHKSRVLHAADPRAGVKPTWPRSRFVPELGFEVYAHGGVFAGTRVDRGTRLLLDHLAEWTPPDGPIVDVGCGTGILATWLSRRHQDADVVASDISAAAIASTRLTAGGAVRCERADGLTSWPDGSIGAVVTNPPFHTGAAKDSTPTLQLIDDAARVVRPGGEVVMVFNAHLPYLPRLRRLGPTEVVRRDHRYLVTRTVRR